MSARSEVDTDIALMTSAVARLEGENAELRRINLEMLAALKCALPVLRDGLLPGVVDFDAIKDATTKVQSAIAQAESD